MTGFTMRVRPRVVAEVVHEEALLHADLRGGQPDARVRRTSTCTISSARRTSLPSMSVTSGASGLQDRVAEDPDLVRRGGARHSAARLSATPALSSIGERRAVLRPSSRRRARRRRTVDAGPPRPHRGAGHRPGRVRRRARRSRHPLLLQEAPPPPPTGDLLDLGCGYGPIALTLARRAPRRHGVGRRRQRAGPRPVRRQRRRATASPTSACVAPDAVPDRCCVRNHLVQSADPHRQGPAARAAAALAGPPGARRRRPPRRAEAPGRRLAGGVADRATACPVHAAAPARPTASSDVTCSQLDGTGLKRLHRVVAAPQRDGRVALVLDGLGTPANVGAIVRTAAAYRVERHLAGRRRRRR